MVVNIDICSRLLYNTPMNTIEIYQKQNDWILENKRPGLIDMNLLSSVTTFYQTNDYLTAELNNHATIRRTSHNMWSANSKEELEHFLTYFTLKYLE